MSECLFCRIAAGTLAADMVYSDESCVVFRDINPQAPIHWLAIPRRHVASCEDLDDVAAAEVGRLLLVVARLAREHGFASTGYRLVVNTGADAGQAVGHLHVHILAKRRMAWPPG